MQITYSLELRPKDCDGFVEIPVRITFVRAADSYDITHVELIHTARCGVASYMDADQYDWLQDALDCVLEKGLWQEMHFHACDRYLEERIAAKL